MRKGMQLFLSIFLILGISGLAQAYYAGPGSGPSTKTVADILKNPVDDEDVILQGKILRKLKKDKYIFSDGTGEIRVEIDREEFRGQRVTDTTLVEIAGEVEKDFMESPEIDVERLTIITP
ncbi:NirD/YgiW/YdeI family stress tolerance protein [Desulfococcaceae bacterium OttesenSCG-928-F15]|nr:NirD/YgiW/YdeI family stress tolerance protein [Desulfococcaceae bacterium OttesenSCG-928-F15]